PVWYFRGLVLTTPYIMPYKPDSQAEMEISVARSRKKPTAQPRALQPRPTISFRTDRAVLTRLDEIAEGHDVTRNDLMERVLKHYLVERGEDLGALLNINTGGPDDRQATLDIFQ